MGRFGGGLRRLTPLGILSTAVDSKHAKITRKDPTMEGNVVCIEQDDVEIKVAHIKPGDRFFRSEAMAHKITGDRDNLLANTVRWLHTQRTCCNRGSVP
jgi:hypothetical protein